jgi:HAD superfamily phosphatase
VIRDVSASYRRAIVETVHHYGGWRPDPAAIDALKAEGIWNNDWHASLELLRRGGLDPLPPLHQLVEVFGGFYFGGDPDGDPALWRGFIGQEPLLVESDFFEALSRSRIAWGFVSGAEPASVRYVLQQRLRLDAAPFLAMGDAPDKPDPSGLLRLAAELLAPWGLALGAGAPPVAYLGDTVADVQTVLRARQAVSEQNFLALAVAPPHLQARGAEERRKAFETQLRRAGADAVIGHTLQALEVLSAPWPPLP